MVTKQDKTIEKIEMINNLQRLYKIKNAVDKRILKLKTDSLLN